MEAERICKVCGKPLKAERTHAKVHRACADEWKAILKTRSRRARAARSKQQQERPPP